MIYYNRTITIIICFQITSNNMSNYWRQSINFLYLLKKIIFYLLLLVVKSTFMNHFDLIFNDLYQHEFFQHNNNHIWLDLFIIYIYLINLTKHKYPIQNKPLIGTFIFINKVFFWNAIACNFKNDFEPCCYKNKINIFILFS